MDGSGGLRAIPTDDSSELDAIAADSNSGLGAITTNDSSKLGAIGETLGGSVCSAGVGEWVRSVAGIGGVGGGLKCSLVASQQSAGLGKWNLGVTSCC